MVANYRFPDGTDFDNVFPARITTATTLTGYRGPDGSDLALRYEKANGAGTSGATGRRLSNGVDLNQVFTTVASNPINGKNFSASGSSNQNNGSATGVVQFSTDGMAQLINQGSDHAPITSNTPWSVAIFAGQGNMYDILFDLQSGTISGSFGTWMRLDQARTISCSRSGNGTSNGTCRWRMRRTDGTEVASGNVNVSANVGQL